MLEEFNEPKAFLAAFASFVNESILLSNSVTLPATELKTLVSIPVISLDNLFTWLDKLFILLSAPFNADVIPVTCPLKFFNLSKSISGMLAILLKSEYDSPVNCLANSFCKPDNI